MLNPTPPEKMLDSQGRPYFLWDCDLDVHQFKRRLEDANSVVRGYFIGKLMRQAKPDVSARTIREEWAQLEKHLGDKRAFWTWLFSTWESQGRVWG